MNDHVDPQRNKIYLFFLVELIIYSKICLKCVGENYFNSKQ